MDELNPQLARSGETDAHRRRVTAFTIAITKVMGLSREQMKLIARGAFLHDIGCAALPESLLQRKASLTSEETMLFQKHCESGYRMLATTPGFEDASEIAYSHHEHYDGSGYPRGVKGADIPLGARIFAIAGRLDNMMSEEPSPESIALAQEEIKELAGKEFDPEIVNEFLRMPANIWQELRNNIDSERE